MDSRLPDPLDNAAESLAAAAALARSEVDEESGEDWPATSAEGGGAELPEEPAIKINWGAPDSTTLQPIGMIGCNGCRRGPAALVVRNRGRKDSPIVIVGEAPSKDDIQADTAQVLSTKSAGGFLLNKVLEWTGLNQFDPWITSAVKCYFDDDMKADDVAQCRGAFLRQEIEAYPRKLVIVLGAWAGFGLNYSPSGVLQRLGRIERAPYSNQMVLTNIHPNFAVKSPDAIQAFYNVMERAAEFMGLKSRKTYVKPWTYLVDVDDWRKTPSIAANPAFYALDMAQRVTKRLAVDTETDSLNTRTCNLLGISWSDDGMSGVWCPNTILDPDKYAAYVARAEMDEDFDPADLPDLFNSEGVRIDQRLREVLLDESVTKVFTNAKYDKPILERYGYHIRGLVRDTLIGSHFYDETGAPTATGSRESDQVGAHGLKVQAEYRLQAEPWDEVTKGVKDFSLLDPSRLGRYAAEDPARSMQLYDFYGMRLLEDNPAYVLANMATDTFIRIERRGITRDMDNVAVVDRIVSERIATLFDELQALAGRQPTWLQLAASRLYQKWVDRCTAELGKNPTKGPKVSKWKDALRANTVDAEELVEEMVDEVPWPCWMDPPVLPTPLNPASGPQLVALVHEEWGCPVVKRSKKTQKPSLDEKAILELVESGDTPEQVTAFLNKLLNYRGATKIKGTYIDGFDRVTGEDGAIHGNFKLTGTRTGRLSCVSGDTWVTTSVGPLRLRWLWLGVTDEEMECERTASPEVNQLELDISDRDLRVLTHTGTFQRVLSVIYKGRSEMFEVRPTNLRGRQAGIVATLDHRLWNGLDWVRVGDLKPGDPIRVVDTDGGVYTDKVQTIQPVGVQGVWDLEVEEDHSYCAQGLIHHNSTKPNLQNLPKSLRPMIVARPGYTFVDADFSQCEVRVAGALSQDINMKRAAEAADADALRYEREMAAYEEWRNELFEDLGCWPEDLHDPDLEQLQASGEWLLPPAPANDLHRMVASVVFGVPPEKVTDEQRTYAKRFVFGALYGKTVKSFTEEFGGDEAKAQAIWDAIFGAFPQLEEWIKRVHAHTKRTGEVTTPYGRTRHLLVAKLGLNSPFKIKVIVEESLRQAVNFLVQSTASEIALQAIVRLDKALLERPDLDAAIVVMVHDAIVVEARKGQEDEVARLVVEAMQMPTGIDIVDWIPQRADYKVYDHWAGKLKPDKIAAELVRGGDADETTLPPDEEVVPLLDVEETADDDI